MKFLLIALAVFTVCAAQSDADWERYQTQYGKLYRSADENTSRRAIWENNWRNIKQHNEDFAKGVHTYTLGENQFTDLTYEEFSKQYLGLSQNIKNQKYDAEHVMSKDFELKGVTQHDMRPLGHVPAIRNQAACGACWAFAVITALEIQYARKNGVQIDLSEQQLVDCSFAYLLGIIKRNNGCNGGQLEPTFADVKSSGCQSESSYPYTASNGTCKYSSSQATYKFTGNVVQVKTEAAILDAAKNGYVVTIGIFVNSNFQSYKSGIYNPTSVENTSQPNHAVAVIGYYHDDAADGQKYYHIRNSWATSWGENGYMRLQYNVKALNLLTMSVYFQY